MFRYFPCHEWLAVDEGPGDVERMLPVSKSPYKTRWDAFISNASFSEHHLWASVFKDHSYCNFTKPERLTVCLIMLFMAMAVNVAFWRPGLDTVILSILHSDCCHPITHRTMRITTLSNSVVVWLVVQVMLINTLSDICLHGIHDWCGRVSSGYSCQSDHIPLHVRGDGTL